MRRTVLGRKTSALPRSIGPDHAFEAALPAPPCAAPPCGARYPTPRSASSTSRARRRRSAGRSSAPCTRRCPLRQSMALGRVCVCVCGLLTAAEKDEQALQHRDDQPRQNDQMKIRRDSDAGGVRSRYTTCDRDRDQPLLGIRESYDSHNGV